MASKLTFRDLIWVSGTELTFIFSTYVLVTEPVTVFVPPSISTFLTHWSDCGSNLISPKKVVIWNGFTLLTLDASGWLIKLTSS